LVAVPHPASQCMPQMYRYPDEIEVVGRVVGVANRFDPDLRRPVRS